MRPSALVMRPVSVITSLTPTIDASVVAIVRIAYQFIHGGSIRFMHCGRMIFHSVCRRENASERAASHCAGRDRLDGAAHDLGDVGHDRQRQAERRLDPVGKRHRRAADVKFEGHQEHHEEQQHEPRRVAEELDDDPRGAAHRRARRDAREPEQHAGGGAQRHREEADQQVEQEALREQRRPLDQQLRRRWACPAAPAIAPRRLRRGSAMPTRASQVGERRVAPSAGHDMTPRDHCRALGVHCPNPGTRSRASSHCISWLMMPTIAT